MKRTLTHRSLRLTFPAVGLLAALAITGCDKPAAPGAATPESPAAAAPLAPAEAAAAYGFVAKVPADAEMVLAGLHWSKLWNGLANSKWTQTLLSLSAMQEGEFRQMRDQWENDPQAQIAKRIASAVLGEEIIVVGAIGTTASAKSILPMLTELQSLSGKLAAANAGGGSPSQAQQMVMAQTFLPLLATMEIPPVYVISKCPGIRKDIEAGVSEMTTKIKESPKPGATLGTTTVGDATFETLTIDAGEIMEANAEQVDGMMAGLFPNKAEADRVTAGLKAKTLSIAWGWSGDHFIVSVGKDQSHLAFAADPAQSILSNASVAPRANAHAGKNPFLISYAGKNLQESMQQPMRLATLIETYAGSVREMIGAAAMDRMVSDANKFDEKHAPKPVTFTDSVAMGWWDGGINMSSWGGPEMPEAPQPLKLAGTLTSSTILHIDGTGGTPGSTRQWLEDFATMAYGWYVDLGRTKMPPEQTQQIAMAEALGLPILKQLWAATGSLNEALGSESAFIVEGGGRIPAIEGMPIPPAVAEKARIPRIAWIAELKNPAKLTEAWTGFKGIIDMIAPMVASQIPGGMPQATEKPVGKATAYYFPLPMDTGDVLPHVASSPDYWMFSTAPTLTESLAATAPAAGEPSHLQVRMQMGALADLGDSFMDAAESENEGKSDRIKAEMADARTAIKLVRSLKGLDARLFKDDSGTRSTLTMKMEDLK